MSGREGALLCQGPQQILSMSAPRAQSVYSQQRMRQSILSMAEAARRASLGWTLYEAPASRHFLLVLHLFDLVALVKLGFSHPSTRSVGPLPTMSDRSLDPDSPAESARPSEPSSLFPGLHVFVDSAASRLERVIRNHPWIEVTGSLVLLANSVNTAYTLEQIDDVSGLDAISAALSVMLNAVCLATDITPTQQFVTAFFNRFQMAEGSQATETADLQMSHAMLAVASIMPSAVLCYGGHMSGPMTAASALFRSLQSDLATRRWRQTTDEIDRAWATDGVENMARFGYTGSSVISQSGQTDIADESVQAVGESAE